MSVPTAIDTKREGIRTKEYLAKWRLACSSVLTEAKS